MREKRKKESRKRRRAVLHWHCPSGVELHSTTFFEETTKQLKERTRQRNQEPEARVRSTTPNTTQASLRSRTAPRKEQQRGAMLPVSLRQALCERRKEQDLTYESISPQSGEEENRAPSLSVSARYLRDLRRPLGFPTATYPWRRNGKIFFSCWTYCSRKWARKYTFFYLTR